MKSFTSFIVIINLMFLISCSQKPNFSKSDHFDGTVFHNIDQSSEKKTFWDFLKWKLFSKKETWPNFIPTKQQKIINHRVNNQQADITFINHATVLIQMNNLNIITDPIFSNRASPVSFAGPKRVKKPGVKLSDLPNIDVILISHNHYDHLDLPTLKYLLDRDTPLILIGLNHKHYFDSSFHSRIIELDWKDQYHLNSVTFTFLEAQHWSKRTLLDTNHSLWGSFVIQGDKQIYFSGDTGYSDHFKRAQQHFEFFDLSLLPIGAYKPRWFMKESHMNPKEAVQAHLDLNSSQSIGIHFGTFQLTDESIDDPIKDLETAK